MLLRRIHPCNLSCSAVMGGSGGNKHINWRRLGSTDATTGSNSRAAANETISTAGAASPNNNQKQNESKALQKQFNELFIMPKRKLMGQLALERAQGRASDVKHVQRDILARAAARKPRREDMPTDQHWPDVWPAAASFKSSVVPLPVRMGTRRDPKKRPPQKTYGNLELLKIPNFLHLTPAHIAQHCRAIKKFCTPFPAELARSETLQFRYTPLEIRYEDFVHQGTNIRDMRSRVVTFAFRLAALRLDTHAHNKFRQLVGERYDEATDTVTFVADRCPTRRQNLDYAYYLLTAVYHESQKCEPWERELAEKDILQALKLEQKEENSASNS